MGSSANPLLPAAYDIAWALLLLAIAALTVTTVVSMVRTRELTGFAFLVGFVIVLALPVLGPIAWFGHGRGAVRSGSRTR
ncbi:hypothetical protein [Microbacterium halophytorum]|uniref:hypothetical protein n=1 Tax=Microbacterium halophytorum TaxID=2067568 RepID=UPI000CFDCEA0|nr:hypothetical protein [Microbacterium halophytorum]